MVQAFFLNKVGIDADFVDPYRRGVRAAWRWRIRRSAGAIVAAEVLPGRSSSEPLVPAVRRLMGAREWRLSELAAVVVVHGPGSFKGVRVGVSAAKGLSEAGEVPVIAVSRLALLAARVEGKAPVFAVLDAGRGEFYVGEYVGRAMGARDVGAWGGRDGDSGGRRGGGE